MKHYYLRFLGLFFLFFLGVGSTSVFAEKFFYEIGYDQSSGRIFITVSVDERDQCFTCKIDKLQDLDITYTINNNTTNLLVDGSHRNRNGNYKNELLVNNNSNWDGKLDKQRYYINIPSAWFGKSVTIRTHYYWGDNSDKEGNKEDTYAIAGLQGSPIITAFPTGEQNQIKLTWDKPGANGYAPEKIRYYIYQNDQLLAGLDYNTTSYIDPNSVYGYRYNYRIVARVGLNREILSNNPNYFDVWSNNITAWKNSKLVLTPTFAPCATGITLTWPKPNLDGAYSYKILRSARPDFSTITNTFDVNGGLNTLSYFDDTNLQHQKS
ncbi:fibronectin type III domain-containing protein [Adhaeribacter radiodurans]|uniref:Fibronectin type III domain-containing protein n=1 Tax=Adhaeribacter radiodurans TaxID=2745197 RepID=A0A7L7L2W6_9BACT|nr:hypothetical protein [Adhaeribacter radiodurans]QMU27141.1 hypothetical protein HUW48_03440 [Adhaeribacter radiodurans]